VRTIEEPGETSPLLVNEEIFLRHLQQQQLLLLGCRSMIFQQRAKRKRKPFLVLSRKKNP
jgi:hypothetical protein